MAYEQLGTVVTMEAGADLSASQYRGVKVTGQQTVGAIAASTDVPMGILQNKPNAAGRAAVICTEGISKAEAGAGITAGAAVMFNNVGKVITAATTGNERVGIALQTAGADGDIISVQFMPFGKI